MIATALAVAALAVLSHAAWAGGPTRTIAVSFGGLHPLAALAHELGVRHGLAVTYEDLPNPEPGDVPPLPFDVPEVGARHLPVEQEPIAVRYEVEEASGLVANPEALLRDAIAAQNRVDRRGSFRLEVHGGIYHLVPATVRRADGSSRPVHSLLDVAIDLPQAERTLQQAFDAVIAAVGRARGVRIAYAGWFALQTRYRIGFSRVPARAALERILELAGCPGLVWHIRGPAGATFWREGYVVDLVRTDPLLGISSSVFEPDDDPPEWQALGPGGKPWRRLGMEEAAALIGSPAEGYRIAGYNAIVARQGSPPGIPAGERTALTAALLPLAAAGDADSWYSTRVLATLALGHLHATAAVPLLLDHLHDDFPRPAQVPDLMLPPAAIALALAGRPAIPAVLARAATADDEEWQLLLHTLPLMDRSAPDDGTTASSEPGTAQVAADLLDHGAGGRARERLLALAPGWQPTARPRPPRPRR